MVKDEQMITHRSVPLSVCLHGTLVKTVSFIIKEVRLSVSVRWGTSSSSERMRLSRVTSSCSRPAALMGPATLPPPAWTGSPVTRCRESKWMYFTFRTWKKIYDSGGLISGLESVKQTQPVSSKHSFTDISPNSHLVFTDLVLVKHFGAEKSRFSWVL